MNGVHFKISNCCKSGIRYVDPSLKSQITIIHYLYISEVGSYIITTVSLQGDHICFVETTYGLEAVIALDDGKIVQIETKQGDKVSKNQVLAFMI